MWLEMWSGYITPPFIARSAKRKVDLFRGRGFCFPTLRLEFLAFSLAVWQHLRQSKQLTVKYLAVYLT